MKLGYGPITVGVNLRISILLLLEATCALRRTNTRPNRNDVVDPTLLQLNRKTRMSSSPATFYDLLNSSYEVEQCERCKYHSSKAGLRGFRVFAVVTPQFSRRYCIEHSGNCEAKHRKQ